MANKLGSEYLEIVKKALDNVSDIADFSKVSKVISNAYINKNKVYTFGTGHSHILGEELYARAGGWNYIVPILLDELTLSSHPMKSTLIERVEGFADVLLGMFPITKGDVIIITSNSGRNGLIVEMAKRAKDAGATVVAVTSILHSNSVKSRHSSGKLLKDIADIVIDNNAPSGDATISVGDSLVGPVSTITNVFIGHTIVIETLKILEEKNIPFEVYVSSNLDGQDEKNAKLMGLK